jgi:hypothetical protein
MRQGPANAGDVCRKYGRPVAPTLETVGRFLVRRKLFTVFVLFAVSLITFVIFVKFPASIPLGVPPAGRPRRRTSRRPARRSV